MSVENIEIKKSIRDFLIMLENYPDDPKYADRYTLFLKILLKIQSPSLPIIEVMTLIKYYSPKIFLELKKLSSRNMMLEILMKQSMAIDLAKKNLEK